MDVSGTGLSLKLSVSPLAGGCNLLPYNARSQNRVPDGNDNNSYFSVVNGDLSHRVFKIFVYSVRSFLPFLAKRKEAHFLFRAISHSRIRSQLFETRLWTNSYTHFFTHFFKNEELTSLALFKACRLYK